jgi:hypothetical protein
VAVFAALLAALFYSLASVLQQWEAERQPPDKELRPSLLARLAIRPRWLAGLGCDMAGYVWQFIALSTGSLVVVQPLLVVGLLFALPIKARFTPYRMGRWGWGGALLTTAALAVFLSVSDPTNGHADVRPVYWAVLLCSAAIAATVLAIGGFGSSPRWKAMAYGTGAGVVYGTCAALTKTCAHLLSHGVGHLFSSWQPYMLAFGGVAGMVLAQSAFQAGPLDASLPTLTATDPVVSVVIGAVLFGESIRSGIFWSGLEVISLGGTVVGIFMLAHTEAVNSAQDRNEPAAAVGSLT